MTSYPTVEAVVINYKRPANIPLILRRLREQSHPCTVTLVDQGGGLSPETYDLAHRVYTLRENYGPWNRYIPAGNYHRDFTYFHDDDMLPGRDVIKHFVLHAVTNPDGVLFGQHGRICVGGYNPVDPEVTGPVTPVSLVIRGYFLRTNYLWALLKFATYFMHPITEDDITLSWALRTYTDKFIYMTAKPGSSALMNEEELPAPFACCDRHGHRECRDRVWRHCEEMSQRILSRERTGVPEWL